MTIRLLASACLLLASTASGDSSKYPFVDASIKPFSQWQRSLIDSLSLGAWPEATSLAADGNAVRDRKDAARLGQRLFFDTRFSRAGDTSCASCHQPQRWFTDGLPVAIAADKGTRNTPTLIGVTLNRWYFADGRRDSAWAQAISPIETQQEMDNDRLTVLRTFFSDVAYRDAYKAIFADPLPEAALLSRAEAASPLSSDEAVRAAWDRFDGIEQRLLNRHFSNLGKVLAAYEQQLRPPPTPFDRFADVLAEGGEAAASDMLSEDALAGLRFFIDPGNQCLKCHQGPTLSDGEFHNIGTARNTSGGLDAGRFVGLKALQSDPFNCEGEFNSGPARVCETREMFGSMGANVVPKGAFRTPTLRQLQHSAPYLHDGRADSLEVVFEHYREPPEGYGDAHELWPVRKLDETVQGQLSAFFDSLSSPIPENNPWFSSLVIPWDPDKTKQY